MINNENKVETFPALFYHYINFDLWLVSIEEVFIVYRSGK